LNKTICAIIGVVSVAERAAAWAAPTPVEIVPAGYV
jgi:hypothetical protein